ncbi:hypothetical protein CAOG_04240 [Capsaspora owczarzaki ATCC 30864]|uniref:Uncharacterized protein n=1 Tax=Capsaspora owczarzaki (strain ATCC 30864) TaxID=595528 RepID=A0A0D2UE98_CAPO3|nr:hypothetical protein CAOG_04240 [Capsaspora owczarzaki ATCC 30864]KJE93451.1 hypothetical protein CAOG_004240 [Capsaspora owczarzaki ATCC 30864]|eukprot:XP_004348065.1 hypothetical protein CAOG_04240 [Capsaspora owczarzaki ATCC 30864]
MDTFSQGTLIRLVSLTSFAIVYALGLDFFYFIFIAVVLFAGPFVWNWEKNKIKAQRMLELQRRMTRAARTTGTASTLSASNTTADAKSSVVPSSGAAGAESESEPAEPVFGASWDPERQRDRRNAYHDKIKSEQQPSSSPSEAESTSPAAADDAHTSPAATQTDSTEPATTSIASPAELRKRRPQRAD